MENLITSSSPPPGGLPVATDLAGSLVGVRLSATSGPVPTHGQRLVAGPAGALGVPPQGTAQSSGTIVLLQGAASNGSTGITVFTEKIFEWAIGLSAGVMGGGWRTLSPYEPGVLRLLLSGSAPAEPSSIENKPLPLSLLSSRIERSALGVAPVVLETLESNRAALFEENTVLSAFQMLWHSLRTPAELSGIFTREGQTANSVTGLRTVDSGPLPLFLFHTAQNSRWEMRSVRERAAEKDYLNEARRQPYETEVPEKPLEKSTMQQMFEAPKSLVGRVIGFLRALFA